MESSSPSTLLVCSQATSSASHVRYLIFHFRFLALRYLSRPPSFTHTRSHPGILRKRLRGDPLPPSRFNLGKAGNAVNVVALCFLAVFWLFQFFPAAPSPAPSEMNWSCVIWTGVLVFFMTYYAFWGRHNYVGPIAYVKNDI